MSQTAAAVLSRFWRYIRPFSWTIVPTLLLVTVVGVLEAALPVLVGLVLGGGAALGVAHIGVIRLLEKENIPIDIVVGSSMGALIASFWCVGLDSNGQGEDLVHRHHHGGRAADTGDPHRAGRLS